MANENAGLIGLVGDVMIERQSVPQRLAMHPGFRAAIEVLKSNALRVVNLEMPLSNRGYRVPKHSNLRSGPEVIADVRALGTDAVSLANNHMMDFGPEALRDTLATCANAGILACGAGEDLDHAIQPVILHRDEVSVGLLSFSSTVPVESDAGLGKPGIAPIRTGFSFEVDANLMVEQPGTMPLVHSWTQQDDVDRAVRAVARLKASVDLAIVALHWGVPSYWLSPSQGLLAEYQRPLGQALIDAGADIIWGHHSHALHPIEVYKNKPIFYSLGNFIFENPKLFMEPESVIANVISSDPLKIELVPIWVEDDGFPLLAEGERSDLVVWRLESLSKEFGTRFIRRDDRLQIELGDA